MTDAKYLTISTKGGEIKSAVYPGGDIEKPNVGGTNMASKNHGNQEHPQTDMNPIRVSDESAGKKAKPTDSVLNCVETINGPLTKNWAK